METQSYSVKNFRINVALSLIFLTNCLHVHGVSLDSDGYYDIVIAIDEQTAQNSNEEYLDNLKAGIQDLSHALWETTDKKFSIRSADIVLPNHWNFNADAFVTTQNYRNSDFRISHEYQVPQTINPTFCGYPGHHIELPYTFFDKYDEPYGPTGKALLTLWARYRWGIFEEHGYPGDPLFPYFWKEWANWPPTEGEEPPSELWKVTSCANAEIKGKYVAGSCKYTENHSTRMDEKCDPNYQPPEVTENPTTLGPDDPSEFYPPPSECRFCPDIANQSATTSLMSFPFIKSLLNFCDETTHNKRAPNRQNLFCQHKSAWEVIKESKDWKYLNEESQNLRAPINFRILKKTEKPLLFILSEGVNKLPDEVIREMSSKLSNLFNNTEHWNVLASVGVFPGQDMKDSYDTLYQWNTPWRNEQEFISAFHDSFESRDNTKFRNFGAALQDIGNRIKDMEHAAGAVVVMLKYGTETDRITSQKWPAYESEAMAAILHRNIRLFVLEGEDNLADADPSAPFRLKSIAELSGGLHLPIRNVQEDVANVDVIMSKVEEILTSGHVPHGRYRLAFKDAGSYRANSESIVNIPLLVNYRNVRSVMFFLHQQKSGQFTNLQIKGPDDATDSINFDNYPQWAKSESEYDYPSRLAKWTASGDSLAEPSEWTCSFECYASYGCEAMIVVIVELDDDQQSEETQLEDNDIKIEVYTSADQDGNVANLIEENVASLKGIAFSVHAKLEKNGHPISNPDLEVMAHICDYRDGRYFDEFFPVVLCTSITLKDNGPVTGDPDLTANDGIFSASYIPEVGYFALAEYPGAYQIFVTAKLLKQKTVTEVRSGPLPVDQEHIRCGSGYQGCWSEPVMEPFFVHADLKRRMEFIGIGDDYKSAATRVMDLRASPYLIGTYDIQWTEPLHKTGSSERQVTSYELYFANNFDELLKGIFRDKVYSVPSPITPGSTITARVNDLEPGEKRWYIMRSILKPGSPEESAWSNVLFLYAKAEYFQTTTTTSTTTTPAPTPTTVRLSTTKPGSTTPPTKPTTSRSTTRRQRTTQSSTRESTTVTTTTEKVVTEKFVEENMRHKKQWYTSSEAIATFSVFGVGMAAVAGGAVAYFKISSRSE